MTTAPQHTPTPWSHDGTRYGRIMDRKGNVVAEVPSSDHPAVSDRHAANAALIVRAVNSHERLLASLRELVLLPNKHRPDGVWAEAEATIAAADPR